MMAGGQLSQQEQKTMTDADAALIEANSRIDDFVSGPWAAYVEVIKKVNFTGEQVIIK